MRSYILSVITVSLIAGLAALLVPASAGTKKYVRLIGSLCVLLVMIAPLSHLIGDIDGIVGKIRESGEAEGAAEDYEAILGEYIAAFSEEKVREGIRDLLKEKFGVPEDECRIRLDTRDGEERKLSRVTILLSGGSVFRDPYAIEDYFSDLLGCACDVAVG